TEQRLAALIHDAEDFSRGKRDQGAVVTADALHAQRSQADYLAGRGAHYLLIVKRNQPGLHAQLAALPWRRVPVVHQVRERGHGRTEPRALKVTASPAGWPFPTPPRPSRSRAVPSTSTAWATAGP